MQAVLTAVSSYVPLFCCDWKTPFARSHPLPLVDAFLLGSLRERVGTDVQFRVEHSAILFSADARLGGKWMGVLLPSPKALCHSPFALPPVTANTQMSVNWVRGVTFVTAALPCNQKETSFVIHCLYTYTGFLGSLILLKVLGKTCEKGNRTPWLLWVARLVFPLICVFNHSPSAYYSLDMFNQALSPTPETQRQKV